MLATIRPRPLLIAALLAAACGGGGIGDDGDDDQTGGGALRVSPDDAVLTIANGVPAEQDYTVVRVADDGAETDVTEEATFALTGTVGRVAGNTLIATAPGTGTVTAMVDDLAASVDVSVFRNDVRVLDGAPAEAAAMFDAATDDPSRILTILYPASGTIVPPNLGDFDVHWRDASGSDLFEVRMKTAYADVRVFMAGDASVGTWIAFLLGEWNVIAHSEVSATITLSVRGITMASPTTASQAKIPVYTARDEIEGGIYYWAAATADGSARGIWRHDMGAVGEPSESFYTETEAGRCVACHALSRDGTKMALTYDGGNGSATVLDVGSRVAGIAAGTQFWNFAAFTPDGNEMLVTSHGAMSVRSAVDGSVVAAVPTSGWATHPDVSPVGDRFVYAVASGPGEDWHFTGGALYTMTYTQASHTFGEETPLAPSAQNNYYPSFSPDGRWVLFNRSSSDAYDDPDAELWVVEVDGSSEPVRLDAANIGPGYTNSWARWAPFEGTFGPGAERIFWLTFSSKRDFGVRLVGLQRPQIWMTPLFPDRAANGQDPTAPSFRLPFQGIDTSNHIAQWTETVVPID